MTLTEGETKALLASSLLVLLAALGRMLVQAPAAHVGAAGLKAAQDLDSALAVAESVHATGERRRQSLAPGELIDPNSASEVELDRLPGVGPSLARAIVANRRREGPFRSLRDLERVPGLGSNTLRRLAPHTTLLGSAAQESAPALGFGGPSQTGSQAGPQARLDLNRASARELDALPGIGPARASAIVRWRVEHGSFRTVDDLLEVPGIGPTILERLRPLVMVGP